jgi:hypothetical protein
MKMAEEKRMRNGENIEESVSGESYRKRNISRRRKRGAESERHIAAKERQYSMA